MAGLECQAGKRCRQPTRWCRWTQSRQNTLVVYTLVAMEDTPDGLTDSLYWRRARDEWHCFKKLAPVKRQAERKQKSSSAYSEMEKAESIAKQLTIPEHRPCLTFLRFSTIQTFTDGV
jgi:hypothetical protein